MTNLNLYESADSLFLPSLSCFKQNKMRGEVEQRNCN